MEHFNEELAILQREFGRARDRLRECESGQWKAEEALASRLAIRALVAANTDLLAYAADQFDLLPDELRRADGLDSRGAGYIREAISDASTGADLWLSTHVEMIPRALELVLGAADNGMRVQGPPLWQLWPRRFTRQARITKGGDKAVVGITVFGGLTAENQADFDALRFAPGLGLQRAAAAQVVNQVPRRDEVAMPHDVILYVPLSSIAAVQRTLEDAGFELA